jgi:hypothetical protein
LLFNLIILALYSMSPRHRPVFDGDLHMDLAAKVLDLKGRVWCRGCGAR